MNAMGIDIKWGPKKLFSTTVLLGLLNGGIASAQKVVDYWYTNTSRSHFHIMGLLVDSNENASVIAYGPSASIIDKNGREVSKTSGLTFLVDSEKKSSPLDSLGLAPISITHKGSHYFVWSYEHFKSDTFLFMGQRVLFNGHGFEFPIQIIETDFNFKVIEARRLHFTGERTHVDLHSVLFDENDQLNIFIKRHGGLRPENTMVKVDTIARTLPDEFGDWYSLIALNNELFASNILVFEADNDNRATRFGYSYQRGSPQNLYTWVYDHSTLKFRHVLEELELIFGEFTYRLSQIDADYSVTKFDTFKTNLTNIMLEPVGNSSAAVFSHWNNLDSIYIQDTGWRNPHPAGSGLVLCEIDKNNRIHAKHRFEGTGTNSSLSFHENRIWVKVAFLDSLFFNDTKIISEGKVQISYFAFDTLFNFLGQFNGPYAPTDLGVGLSDGGDIVVLNNQIHDANLFWRRGCIGDQCFEVIPDSGQNSANILYTRLAISTIPIERPDFYYDSLSCSSIRLNYRKTDAQHYTVLVSNDSIMQFPKNGKNYNYSPDYLRSSALGRHTRILYQGPDTSVTITNLIAGRQYFFTVVPGNGPPYFTSYNTDSIKILSLSIPESTIQDSLWATPSIDTGVCEFDTLRFSANPNFEIKWMDGSAEPVRALTKTESYSYRVSDAQDCVASSDTFVYSVYPNPELSSFKIVSEKPWCQGDTVQLQASAQHNLLWSTKETSQDIKITASGWYGVTATSDKNCTTTDSLEIRFNEAPIFQFSGDSLVLYADQTELLPDFKTNADSFQWIYSGDTSNSYTGFPPIDKAFLKAYALHKSGCYAVDSLLTLVLPVQLNVLPNAFTPNGDGVNDVWKFYPSDSTGTLTVFDRWGEILLRDRTQQWDGVKQDQVLPDGVYFLMYEYEEGNEKKRLETPVFLMR